ncbi:hypothetical protein M2109_005054, partial [Paenibacillus sp. PastH-3]|nr:hypothetical protein [Paenibacillus sp. PastH-4]MDH6446895.1 hypothetical protein [Paenibacillus sp. PastF-4]MDH6530696.1 hypothetical protein [Paenibacillus sp. PastH-3]
RPEPGSNSPISIEKSDMLILKHLTRKLIL